jgi:hypothetical protein
VHRSRGLRRIHLGRRTAGALRLRFDFVITQHPHEYLQCAAYFITPTQPLDRSFGRLSVLSRAADVNNSTRVLKPPVSKCQHLRPVSLAFRMGISNISSRAMDDGLCEQWMKSLYELHGMAESNAAITSTRSAEDWAITAKWSTSLVASNVIASQRMTAGNRCMLVRRFRSKASLPTWRAGTATQEIHLRPATGRLADQDGVHERTSIKSLSFACASLRADSCS